MAENQDLKEERKLEERERSVSGTELPCQICLFQSLVGDGEMDQIIETAVELGAFEIVPMVTDRTAAFQNQGQEERVCHWNKTARAEAGKARRTFVPQVSPILTFADAVSSASGFDRSFIPYEMEKNMDRTREEFRKIRPGDSVAILIGPENGFSPEEIALAKKEGIMPVTLGRRVLRPQSAAMSVLAVLMFLLEQEW